MSKPRPKILYAIVNSKRPTITHLELYADTDIRTEKGEEIWEVEVKATRIIHKRKPSS